MPGMAEREQPAVGDERALAVDRDPPAHHEVPAFALLAEAERLELADQLERERVVELAHVDVGGAQTALRERALRGAAPAPAIAIPDRRRDVGHALALDRAAEQVDRLDAEVGGALGGGEHEPRAALGVDRAVEQVIGIGHHARREHVLRASRGARRTPRRGCARRDCGSSPPPRRATRVACRRGACGGARSARTRRRCRGPSTRRTRWWVASRAKSTRDRCTRRPARRRSPPSRTGRWRSRARPRSRPRSRARRRSTPAARRTTPPPRAG